VNVVRLPATADAKKTFANMNALASGFGRVANSNLLIFSITLINLFLFLAGGGSKVLNFIDLTVMKNANCATYYGEEIVTSSTLCTNLYKTKSICSVSFNYSIRKNFLQS